MAVISMNHNKQSAVDEKINSLNEKISSNSAKISEQNLWNYVKTVSENDSQKLVKA